MVNTYYYLPPILNDQLGYKSARAYKLSASQLHVGSRCLCSSTSIMADLAIQLSFTAKVKCLLMDGQRCQYGCHKDFSSSSFDAMFPFRKTYNARKFA